MFERDFEHSSSIFAVKADGSRLVSLTAGRSFDVAPAFSPDGRRFVLCSDRGGATLDDLWVMNANGADLHRVVHLRYSGGAPGWQPFSSAQRPVGDAATR